MSGSAQPVLPAARGAGVAARALPGLTSWGLPHQALVHTEGWHDTHLDATIAGDPGQAGHDAGERA